MTCDKTDDDSTKKEKLEDFISKVSTGRLIKEWHDKSELQYHVSQSINYAKKSKPAVGYVSADISDIKKL